MELYDYALWYVTLADGKRVRRWGRVVAIEDGIAMVRRRPYFVNIPVREIAMSASTLAELDRKIHEAV